MIRGGDGAHILWVYKESFKQMDLIHKHSQNEEFFIITAPTQDPNT